MTTYYLDLGFNWNRVAEKPGSNRYELDHYLYMTISGTNKPFSTYRAFVTSGDEKDRDKFRIQAYNLGPESVEITSGKVCFRAESGGNNNNPIDSNDATRTDFALDATHLPNPHPSHPFGRGLERWNLLICGISNTNTRSTSLVREGHYLMGCSLTITGPDPANPATSVTKFFDFDPEWVVNPGNPGNI